MRIKQIRATCIDVAPRLATQRSVAPATVGVGTGAAPGRHCPPA